jgi:uncharacterized protein YjbI with pentapeptide repeats
MTHVWPISITALSPLACGAVRLRKAGTSWITVIAKATFEVVHGQPARLIAPAEIVLEDRYRERTGSLELARDTAPFLPNAGVVLTGNAYPLGGQPAARSTARLAILRERPLLDKTLSVIGDRKSDTSPPDAFVKMPIVYERAFGGGGVPENPVGVGARSSTLLPNVVHASRPDRAAGFGPISKYWPERMRLLGPVDERSFDGEEAPIPEGFDWRYFHSAPADQQIELLRGDEWILLEGLHPELASIQTRLPFAVARARWHVLTPAGLGPAQLIEMVADTLSIDAERRLASVVWRGRFVLPRPDMLPWIRVVTALELSGHPVGKDSPSSPSPPNAPPPIQTPVIPAVATSPIQVATPAPPPVVAPASVPSAGPAVIPKEPAINWAPGPEVASTLEVPVSLGPKGPVAMPKPTLSGTTEFNLSSVLSNKLPFVAPNPDVPPPASVRTGPPVQRAPESLTGTSEMNLSEVIARLTPFGTPPAPVASTVGPESPAKTPLPFVPADPSKPVAIAAPSGAPKPRSAFGMTADADMQKAIRAAVPFAGASQPQVAPQSPQSVVREPTIPEPVPGPPPPAMLGILPSLPPDVRPAPAAPPPMMMPLAFAPPSPPSVVTPEVAVAPVLPPAPVVVSAPPIAAPSVPTASVTPPPVVAPTVEAPAAESPKGLREEVLARIAARSSLQGLALGGADLQDFDFEGVSLVGVDLRRANLRRARFTGVQAADVQLEGADLTEATFERADLTRANLMRAVLTRARFDAATMSQGNLQRASGEAPCFRGTKLDAADLRQVSFSAANFDEASLNKAVATRADLSGARFVRADLSAANLREVKLRDADLNRSNLEGADLRDADLLRARLDTDARSTAKLSAAQIKSLSDKA